MHIAQSGGVLLSLAWNGQDDICSHRRGVAHGAGGNQGERLVL